MATERHNTTIVTPQTPPDQRGERFAGGRFRLPEACRTADDVRAQAARVRDWRDRVWPSSPPRIAEPPAPPPPRPVAKLVALATPDAPALPAELFIQFSEFRYQVDSFQHASEMYLAAREAFGGGVTCAPEVTIVTADGHKVAHVDRDGRVWPAVEHPGKRPLYDPAPEPMQAAVSGRVLVRLVLHVTATHFGTTVPVLISDSRKQALVRQRWVAMFIARKLTGRGLPFIAEKMGGRDHTTILHGVRAVNALIKAGDAATVEAVNAIVEKLGGANV